MLKQRQLAGLWPEHQRPPALPPGPAQLAVRDLRQGAESVGSLYRGPPEGSVNNALHIAPAPLGEGAGGGGGGGGSEVENGIALLLYRRLQIKERAVWNYTWRCCLEMGV